MLFGGGWETNTTVVSNAGVAGKKRKRTKSETGSQPNVTRALDKIDKQLTDAPAAKSSKKQKSAKQELNPAPPPTPAVASKKEKAQKSPPKSVAQDSTPTAGLTPLQASMKKKLDGARFRHINEVLYKVDSAEATSMMQADPKIFDEYHSGFRKQVESWPTNPVDIFIKELSSLPPGSVIADLGCGEAAIAQTLTPKGYCVLSFDLVSNSSYIVAADTCSRIPLPGAEDSDDGAVVDVCVCALSLMNANWLSCVRETRRVLKASGTLKIAEVTSRFKDVDQFVALVEKVGFKLLNKRSPSSHFTLFEFRKTKGPAPNETSWDDLASQQDTLQPCEYKRR